MLDFYKITSKENETVKQIMQLQKSAKHRRESGFFVLEGLRLCLDAVNNGCAPEIVVATSSFLSENSESARELFEKANKKYEVSDTIFKKISDTATPQGILSLNKIPSFSAPNFSENSKLIVLENIQDPANLGAVSRTAEALGIDGIIIDGGCDPYSSKSLRASMGALLRIPVYSINNSIDFLKTKGIKTYASVVNCNTAKALGSFRLDKRCAVYIGNEANGLTASTISKCDERITIPMSGRAESLNAAVAASILMWEMCK